MIGSILLQFPLAAFAGWAGRYWTPVIACLAKENRVLKEQLEFDGDG